MEEDYNFRLYEPYDYEREIASIRNLGKNLTPEKAKELLKATGMYDENGIKEKFR
jgi:hypothetical protein